MRVRLFSGRVAAIGIAMALGATFSANDADARGRSAHGTLSHTGTHAASNMSFRGSSGVRSHLSARFARHIAYASRLQCVPFARENTGIELSGNANTWWNGADGVYQRGASPEVGSILNFRANGRMRLGHVAVVSNVVDSRNIEIDHANWAGGGRGGVSRNINVVDVSPNNDWTAVRVALGHTGEFGSVYPTFGFIYDRPDNGTLVANNNRAPAPLLNAAPRDLRPAADRMETATAVQENEEVAEADDDVQPHFFRRTGRHSRLLGRHAPGRVSMAHLQSHGIHGHHSIRRHT